jgi:phosphoribosylamine--glycine ligase
VLESIVHPTGRGMAAEGSPYTGVLYVGLMIDAQGAPRVIEYNARFGDPETQPLVLRMQGDLVPLLEGAALGRLGSAPPLGWSDAAVCVVLASGGYPREFRTGLPIDGLEAAERAGAVVFHAGTKRGERGAFETAGGRVLGVTARGATLAAARAGAYDAVANVRFEGMHFRRDIAARAAT